MRWVLDIGHGGTNPATGELDVGAVVKGIHEHDCNLQIADALAHLAPTLYPWAELRGYTPQVWSHTKRAAAAKAYGADLVVSIHCNASPTGDEREHGPLVFWDPERIGAAPYANRVSSASCVRGGEYLEAGEVRQMLRHQIRAQREPHWSGRAHRVLAAYSAVGVNAILVECGYLTSPHELTWLTSRDGHTEAARIIATALERRITR